MRSKGKLLPPNSEKDPQADTKKDRLSEQETSAGTSAKQGNLNCTGCVAGGSVWTVEVIKTPGGVCLKEEPHTFVH